MKWTEAVVWLFIYVSLCLYDVDIQNFSGGAELLFDKVKKHNVTLPDPSNGACEWRIVRWGIFWGNPILHQI